MNILKTTSSRDVSLLSMGFICSSDPKIFFLKDYHDNYLNDKFYLKNLTL